MHRLLTIFAAVFLFLAIVAPRNEPACDISISIAVGKIADLRGEQAEKVPLRVTVTNISGKAVSYYTWPPSNGVVIHTVTIFGAVGSYPFDPAMTGLNAVRRISLAPGESRSFTIGIPSSFRRRTIVATISENTGRSALSGCEAESRPLHIPGNTPVSDKKMWEQ